MAREKKLRFNALDTVICAVLVLCIAALGIRFYRTSSSSGGGDVSQMAKYRISFLVSDIKESTRDAFVPGDSVFLSDGELYIGTLEGLDTVSPAYRYLDNGKGALEKVYYPDGTRIDVTGSVIAQGLMEEEGFLCRGLTFISPGKTLTVHTGHLQVDILVTSVTEYNG